MNTRDLAAQTLTAQLGGSVTMPCPDCGAAGPHDSNGDSDDPQALCADCGTCFNVEIARQDAEHRAYLDETPDAWEHHNGRS